MTFFPQPNEGLGKWVRSRFGIRSSSSESSRETSECRRYFKALKEELKTELEQEEILIVERDVETL